MRQAREQTFSTIIFAGTIIPTAAIRWLELNAAKRVERLAIFRSGTKNQYTRAMVCRRPTDVPHGKDEPVVAVFLFCVKHAASFAETRHDAILDRPVFRCFHCIRPFRARFPSIQRRAVKDSNHRADFVERRLRKWSG
jgi:hypothetical protein